MGFFRDSDSQILIPGILFFDFFNFARSQNPENPEIPGMGIGIWKFRKHLERKIPKTTNPGERDRNSKTSKNTFKIWEFWAFTVFGPSGFFRDFLSLGIFIPGLRDFSESRDFIPTDSGFLEFFYPQVRDFVDEIPRQKATSCYWSCNQTWLLCLKNFGTKK